MDSDQQLAVKQEMLEKLNAINEQLYNENIRLKGEKEKLEKEKDEALSRLSKLAGQRLTNGNPDITDLSDPNRPAKIADRWSSLYTDEWTNAFEAIEVRKKQMSEDGSDPEKQLLQIVDSCYKTCKEISEDLNKVITDKVWDLVNHIHFLGKGSSAIVPKARLDKQDARENQVLVEAIQPFMEQAANQRRLSSSLKQTVINKCYENYIKVTSTALSEEVKRFVMKCSELCWFMCNTEPPMVIEYKDLEGKSIDNNKFNLYNIRGTIVQFVIWPVLLLYKDGPVLAKGTVQTSHEVKSSPKAVTNVTSPKDKANIRAPTCEISSQKQIPPNEHCGLNSTSNLKMIEMKVNCSKDDVISKTEETSASQQLSSETSDGGHQSSVVAVTPQNGKILQEISAVQHQLPDVLDVNQFSADETVIESTAVSGVKNQSTDNTECKKTALDTPVCEQQCPANVNDTNERHVINADEKEKISDNQQEKQHATDIGDADKYVIISEENQPMQQFECGHDRKADNKTDNFLSNLSIQVNVEHTIDDMRKIEEKLSSAKEEQVSEGGEKYGINSSATYKEIDNNTEETVTDSQYEYCVSEINDKYDGDLCVDVVSKEQTNNTSLNSPCEQGLCRADTDDSMK